MASWSWSSGTAPLKELCEDADEERTLEKAIEEKNNAIDASKGHIRKPDKRQSVVQVDATNWLDHSWHDQRIIGRVRQEYRTQQVGNRRMGVEGIRCSARKGGERGQQGPDYELQDDGLTCAMGGVETEVVQEGDGSPQIQACGRDANNKEDKYIRKPVSRTRLNAFRQERKKMKNG